MNDQMTHISEILKQLSKIDHIKAEEIPNIDLYMDQVTTFMDSHLEHSKRYPEDKILTKTMINNYAKNRLLPPPNKKKYSKDHMLLLLFIYYFKNILSINDIQSLLMPICEKYFGRKEGLNLEEIYEEVFALEKEQLEPNNSRCQYHSNRQQDGDYLPFFFRFHPTAPYFLWESFCKNPVKYAGSSLVNSRYSPVRGCRNPMVRACRHWPCREATPFLGPYTGSPATGCPIYAICTRIWWVRPVSSTALTWVNPG